MDNEFPEEGHAPIESVIRSFYDNPHGELDLILWLCEGNTKDMEAIWQQLCEKGMYYHCEVVNRVKQGMLKLN